MNGYIVGLSRGHNAGVCLLKDGEIIFSIEEERLSRRKYDGGPYAGLVKVLEYTDKVDYIVMAHTQPEFGQVEFSGDSIFTGLARKLRLIDDPSTQIINVFDQHHKMHAACAFYRSGFDSAAAIIVDGAGTFIPSKLNGEDHTVWEVETIFDCYYPHIFNTKYKHLGGRGPYQALYQHNAQDNENNNFELIVDEAAGITKAYEAVTTYCGWASIEAGKTMGLFPYGKPNNKIPLLFDNDNNTARWSTANRDIIIPTYPNGAVINYQKYEFLDNHHSNDVTLLQNRRDLAYAVQTQTQSEMLKLIEKAIEKTGKKQIVISGGYGLNCVANYWYLDKLPSGVELYVEPISNDAGTSIGAALYWYHKTSNKSSVRKKSTSLYLGPKYSYTEKDFREISEKYECIITNEVDYRHIVYLLRQKNIVTIFQGRSENGPRALGNRSILFDPTFKDGKDFVNNIKKREYFRPFAATVLEEDASEWFDLRGMKNSPHMMYAVNCKEGVAEKIPSVIHIDGTCRIQTVSYDENAHYYNLISEFKKETGIPLLFNTSFNLGGDPLVETLDDAIATLSKSQIEYCYFPEYKKLLKISNN